MRRLRFCIGGWKQKFHYIWFSLWAIWHCLWWRPRWIYASEPLSCPIALMLSYLSRIKIIYHEHDSPDLQQNVSGFTKYVLKARKDLALKSELCVLPNEERMKKFIQETGRAGDTFCIWNCPRLEETTPQRKLPRNRELTLYYHGTISRDHLPFGILKAVSKLPSEIILKIIGYETVGSSGYVSELKKEANRLGIAERIEIINPMSRYQILEYCSNGDIGLAFIPMKSQDTNNINKTGASVKAFDYMALGLALLVSDLPDWRKMYVEPRYGLACNPEDPEDIVRVLRWFLEHPEETREMGERGRQKILSEWNYERQFEPVSNIINRS
ncbi:MAG: glycosyltransferase [Candidatus Omnitrophica bacterium]|nr:glycosyltransferase [Candidatus Omnitrophota bacterium]